MKRIEEIENLLKREYKNININYKRLKKCKYFLLILKTIIISCSIGLSFLNPLVILSTTSIPIIDSILLITDKEKRISELKLKKDIINQIVKNIEVEKHILRDQESIDKFILELNGKIETFLDI